MPTTRKRQQVCPSLQRPTPSHNLHERGDRPAWPPECSGPTHVSGTPWPSSVCRAIFTQIQLSNKQFRFASTLLRPFAAPHPCPLRSVFTTCCFSGNVQFPDSIRLPLPSPPPGNSSLCPSVSVKCYPPLKFQLESLLHQTLQTLWH